MVFKSRCGYKQKVLSKWILTQNTNDACREVEPVKPFVFVAANFNKVMFDFLTNMDNDGYALSVIKEVVSKIPRGVVESVSRVGVLLSIVMVNFKCSLYLKDIYGS